MIRKVQSECFFPKAKIEHFECFDDDLITFDAPSAEDIVSLIKEKNNLIGNSCSYMKDKGDASLGPTISGAKAAVNIFQNFFATETVDKNVMYSFMIIDETIDELYLKSKSFPEKIMAYFHTLEQWFPTCGPWIAYQWAVER
ncbi:hypothetical protein AVEN_181826-1 [Araneus ventricosus]|uniref:Uncharacterized protein n=1 Tax=Araneus ventricosus TaxID=182803 RepID=A0A4Y2EWG8_ARAVE|nr:hypothetical protein AVEN_181826-1 [Araneus ventricosus]